MVNLETISVIVFFGIVGLLAYLDRKNIEFKYGLITRRTKKGKKFIYDFGKRHKKKLKILGNIGIVVCIVAAILGFFSLVRSSYDILFKPEEAAPGIKLVFPSVSGLEMPGFVLGVPFWYWIVGVFVVLFAHEPMHALLVRAEGVKIKSFGVLLLFFLPGAFVEPDEKQLKKQRMMKKIRIYAAGSLGNLIVAGVFLLLILGYNFSLNSVMTGRGVMFEETIEDTGAQEAGLKGVIIGIDEKDVNSMSDFIEVMEGVDPGEKIKIETTEGDFEVKTSPHPDDPERPFIGIKKARTLLVYKGIFKDLGVVPENVLYLTSWVTGLLSWIFILNLGIGVFNLFPIKPLDGGLIFEAIVKRFYKGKNVDYIVNGVTLFTIFLVLFNLFGQGLISFIGL